MAVRSKRLTSPINLTTAPQVLYTCPLGETALIKQLSAVNTAALATTLILRLNSPSNAGAMLQRVVPGSGDLQLSELFWVLQPADVLTALTTNGTLICTLFGAELEGVAD